MQSKLLKSAVLAAAAVPRKTAALGAAICLVAGFAYTPAQAAVGWQEISTFNVPTGQVSQQFGYNCPADAQVAHSGSFAMNATGQTSQVFLTYNGTRLDIPSFSEWAWHFYWPSGAPAGTVILFDVYCAKR